MNKKTWIIIVVLIIIIGALALTSQKKTQVDTTSVTPPTPTETATKTPVKPATKPVANPTSPNKTVVEVQNPNALSNTDWHIAFTKGSDWTVTNTQLSNKIVLNDTTGDGKGDSITMQYVMGDTISDADAKFGNITYYYEKSTQQWLQTSDQLGNSTSPDTKPEPAKIVAYTADKLPVFPGTGRWLTYIVPLSTNTFLKLNITGSGATQPLQDLVKTIRKI